ncbi:MAG: hypothetical protein HY823_12080 [Acidobacteria bacterium]|nr:hypothetical protein [Acidobacteriota bacterium]
MAAYGPSLSGLSAAALQVAAAAGNVANLNSKDYRARRVDFSSSPDGGVHLGQVSESQETPVEGSSNVDLATEMVQLLSGSFYFRANAAAFRAQDKLLGATLDLKA